MRSFFNGWRRKIGVATLSMTCLFAGAWVRSLTNGISLIFLANGQTHLVASERGALMWKMDSSNDGSPMQAFHRINWNSYTIKPLPISANSTTPEIDEWRRRWCGFDFRKYHYEGTNYSSLTRIVPYWSIIIPLTLQSTWLLLGRSRVRPNHVDETRLDLNASD